MEKAKEPEAVTEARQRVERLSAAIAEIERSDAPRRAGAAETLVGLRAELAAAIGQGAPLSDLKARIEACEAVERESRDAEQLRALRVELDEARRDYDEVRCAWAQKIRAERMPAAVKLLHKRLQAAAEANAEILAVEAEACAAAGGASRLGFQPGDTLAWRELTGGGVSRLDTWRDFAAREAGIQL
jgi:hypothetical protein